MNSRTVLSCIPIFEELRQYTMRLDLGDDLKEKFRNEFRESLFGLGPTVNTTSDLLSWFTGLKTGCEIKTRFVPLDTLADWTLSANEMSRVDDRYFSVIAISTKVSSREVVSWTQPIIAPCEKGIAGFIVKHFSGTLHFLVQAKLEPGSFDIMELAPTVQYTPGEISTDEPISQIPFLGRILAANSQEIRHDSLQSEEGGRFYCYQNRNVVVQLDDAEGIDLPRNYMWMSLRQIKEFIQHSMVNIEARSVLACLGLAV